MKIFGDMERGQQLLKYYRKCLKARALKVRRVFLADGDTN